MPETIEPTQRPEGVATPSPQAGLLATPAPDRIPPAPATTGAPRQAPQEERPADERPVVDRTMLVWRAKGIILAVASLVGAATLGISMLLPATYEASSTVRVAAQSGSNSQEAVLASNDLASQYAQLATSAPVLRASELELGLAPGALNGVASGGTLGDQNLIGITVQGPDAEEVGVHADTIAANLVTELQRANREQAAAYAQRVEEQLAPLDRRIRTARTQIAGLSSQVAAGGTAASGAAALLSAAQSNLNNLENRRDSVASDVAQVAAVVQPSVSVWSSAGVGGKVQPKPVLYTIVAVILAALVTAQLVVMVGSRKEPPAS